LTIDVLSHGKKKSKFMGGVFDEEMKKATLDRLTSKIK
jgi:hypothetical protein